MFKRLADLLRRANRKTFHFYLKSGNVIRVDGVNGDTFKFFYQGDEIVRIEGFEQAPWVKRRLNLASLNLSQIEAIVSE